MMENENEEEKIEIDSIERKFISQENILKELNRNVPMEKTPIEKVPNKTISNLKMPNLTVPILMTTNEGLKSSSTSKGITKICSNKMNDHREINDKGK